jgi:hypothetical protein
MFLLVQVDFAILGADFLKHFNLMVNHSAGQLLENTKLQIFLVVDAIFLQWWRPHHRSLVGSSACSKMPPTSLALFLQLNMVLYITL